MWRHLASWSHDHFHGARWKDVLSRPATSITPPGDVARGNLAKQTSLQNSPYAGQSFHMLCKYLPGSSAFTARVVRQALPPPSLTPLVCLEEIAQNTHAKVCVRCFMIAELLQSCRVLMKQETFYFLVLYRHRWYLLYPDRSIRLFLCCFTLVSIPPCSIFAGPQGTHVFSCDV